MVSVLVFGACLLHGPLNPLNRTATNFSYPDYGPLPGCYTFGEMFQAIDLLRGLKDVPQEYRPLCAMRPNFRPVGRAAHFADVDVALIEPSSPVELEFRGCSLNRVALAHSVIHPITERYKDARKAAGAWLRIGLIGMNDEARIRSAAELVKFISDDMEHAELMRSVILETRSRRSDIPNGFRRMQELLGRPMGVVVYVFQYLEDGRAISWPAGFHEEVLEAATELDLPMFQPAQFVRDYGLKNAMKDDLRHYSDEFSPVIGNELIKFSQEILDRSRAIAAE